ncbi:hypothetical protein [Microvirga brassicacearum]|uniref:Uncharacterized protein n=1 Tax=Microvirga brassicacearum TaxID=2580413 RepID=A0A5N3PH53_9HYPH|nr:hypothetical protein [Microvirga brassicacearum]KAB0269061.1 hypothetical protein FEZ63_02840 [Microvirga brassicacearum]
MQKFDAYEAIASENVDDLFGEEIYVEPRADGEFVKGTADPLRVAFSTVGVVDFSPKTMKTRYGGRNDADASELVGELLHISIREVNLPTTIKPGDRVQMLSRPLEPVAAVTTVEPDGLGRVILRCKPGKMKT